jgi:hypothetical protein
MKIDMVQLEYQHAIAEDVVEWIENVEIVETDDLMYQAAQREFTKSITNMKMARNRLEWIIQRYKSIDK